MHVLLLSFLIGAPAGPSSISAPPDVRGFSRGVDAVALDPAAPSAADGFALQYRHRLRSDEKVGQVGAFATIPMGGLALSGGYEWLREGDAEFQRGTVGLSAQLGGRLALGVAYRGFANGLSGGVWDAGFFGELSSYLTLSFGIDGFNTPRVGGARLRPSYVLGGSIRPIMGQSWLTLGAEGRVSTDATGKDYEPRFSRAVLDVSPLSGVHALVAYQRVGDDDQIWAGLSLSLQGLEVRAASLGGGDDVPGESSRMFDDTALAITLQTRPSETLFEPSGRRVEMVLAGSLTQEPGFFEPAPTMSLAAMRLHRLAEDPTVGEVLLRIGKLEVGMATIDDLRRGVRRLRDAGKTVTARIAGVDDKSYMVAAACDRISMDPSGTLFVNGFAVARRYFADGLQKLGIRFDSVEIGRYKSGPDALTRNSPREGDDETQGAILDSAYEGLTRALTEDRKLSLDDAKKLITQGILSAQAALDAGLVDELTVPTDPKEVPPVFTGGERDGGGPPPTTRWGGRPTVAVIPIVGTIVNNAGDNPLPGDSAEAGAIVAALEAARRDSDVIGAVLRVESPGGDVLASDIIWRAVRRLAEDKPLVVSMGDVAASGGYYVATPAHAIFAQPNTITGSIGIFTIKPDLSGLYDLIGLRSHVYKTNDLSDWDFSEGPLSPEARKRMEAALRSHYDAFIQKVVVGREKPEEEIRKLAEGRVYTGQQALEAGLVDSMGGLVDAVADVKKRAGMQDRNDVVVSVPRRSLSLENLVLDTLVIARSPLQAVTQDAFRRIRALQQHVFALMPMHYDIVE